MSDQRNQGRLRPSQPYSNPGYYQGQPTAVPMMYMYGPPTGMTMQPTFQPSQVPQPSPKPKQSSKPSQPRKRTLLFVVDNDKVLPTQTSPSTAESSDDTQSVPSSSTDSSAQPVVDSSKKKVLEITRPETKNEPVATESNVPARLVEPTMSEPPSNRKKVIPIVAPTPEVSHSETANETSESSDPSSGQGSNDKGAVTGHVSTDQEENLDKQERDDAEDDAEAEEEDEEDGEEETEEVDNSPKYPINTWSPFNPDLPKVYPVTLLQTFQPLCRLPLPKDNPDLDKIRSTATAYVSANKHPRSKARSGGVTNVSFARRGKKTPKTIELPVRLPALQKSENAWKPKDDKELSESEKILAKAQSILNKLTEEKFDSLSNKLIELGGQLEEKDLVTFTAKIFQKAVEETFFSAMYARLCTKMSKSSKLQQFRRILLNQCQQEFMKDRTEETRQLDALRLKSKAGEITKEEDEELYKLERQRRHMFGNIKFIGELFVERMVPPGIIHKDCISPFMDDDNVGEDALECLCKLLETAGGRLETTKDDKSKDQMDKYMARLKSFTNRPGLESRLKFMIMDVIEMRSRSWTARRKVAGPKKIEEIHRDAEKEKLMKKTARSNDRSRREKKPSGSDWNKAVRNQSSQKRIGMSKYKSQAPPQQIRNIKNAFDALDEGESSPEREPPRDKKPEAAPVDSEKSKKMSIATIKEYLNILDKKEVVLCFEEDNVDRGIFVEQLFRVGADESPTKHSQLVELFRYLLIEKKLDHEAVMKGLVPAVAELEDISLDSPKAGEYFATLIAEALVADIIDSNDVDIALKPLFNKLDTILLVLVALKKSGHEEKAKSFVSSLPAKLSDYEPRKDERRVTELLERKELLFLIGDSVGETVSGSAPPGQSDTVDTILKSIEALDFVKAATLSSRNISGSDHIQIACSALKIVITTNDDSVATAAATFVSDLKLSTSQLFQAIQMSDTETQHSEDGMGRLVQFLNLAADDVKKFEALDASAKQSHYHLVIQRLKEELED